MDRFLLEQRIADLETENNELKIELDLAKRFHDLAIKERDFERYKVDSLREQLEKLKNCNRG